MKHSFKIAITPIVFLCSSTNAMFPPITSNEFSIIEKGSLRNDVHATLHLNLFGPDMGNVGKITFCYDDQKIFGYITRLDTNERFRNRGVASHLVRYACKKMRDTGCPKVFVYAAPSKRGDLPKLIKLYKRHGFILDTPFIDDPLCTSCYMHKNLYPNNPAQTAELFAVLPFAQANPS